MKYHSFLIDKRKYGFIFITASVGKKDWPVLFGWLVDWFLFFQRREQCGQIEDYKNTEKTVSICVWTTGTGIAVHEFNKE